MATIKPRMTFLMATRRHLFISCSLRGAILMPKMKFKLFHFNFHFDFKQLMGIDSRCLWCCVTAAGCDAFKSVKQNPFISSLDRNYGHCIAVLFNYQQIGGKILRNVGQYKNKFML
jgi:hypothetical protein